MKLHLLILATTLTLTICATSAFAAIINVPDDFETIQGAIDEADDGDTVLVAPGEYVENIARIENPYGTGMDMGANDFHQEELGIIGRFNTPGRTSAVWIEDEIAYIADNTGGLRILDVSSPDNIVELGSANGWIGDIHVAGNYAYMPYTGPGDSGYSIYN